MAMSAAQRQSISEGLRRYWATKKRAGGSGGGGGSKKSTKKPKKKALTDRQKELKRNKGTLKARSVRRSAISNKKKPGFKPTLTAAEIRKRRKKR